MDIELERRTDIAAKVLNRPPSPNGMLIHCMPETEEDEGSIKWLEHLESGDFSVTFAGYRAGHEKPVTTISLIKGGFRKRVEEMAQCEGDCHTVGHYECWKDNCNCICHAARRVLGTSLPKSYVPVPRR